MRRAMRKLTKERADKMPREDPQKFWARVRAEYDKKVLSLRTISEMFWITEGAIRYRAKQDGWATVDRVRISEIKGARTAGVMTLFRADGRPPFEWSRPPAMIGD